LVWLFNSTRDSGREGAISVDNCFMDGKWLLKTYKSSQALSTKPDVNSLTYVGQTFVPVITFNGEEKFQQVVGVLRRVKRTPNYGTGAGSGRVVVRGCCAEGVGVSVAINAPRASGAAAGRDDDVAAVSPVGWSGELGSVTGPVPRPPSPAFGSGAFRGSTVVVASGDRLALSTNGIGDLIT
jgi:hypothetical protein